MISRGPPVLCDLSSAYTKKMKPENRIWRNVRYTELLFLFYLIANFGCLRKQQSVLQIRLIFYKALKMSASVRFPIRTEPAQFYCSTQRFPTC